MSGIKINKFIKSSRLWVQPLILVNDSDFMSGRCDLFETIWVFAERKLWSPLNKKLNGSGGADRIDSGLPGKVRGEGNFHVIKP